jgi:hypothetical protein
MAAFGFSLRQLTLQDIARKLNPLLRGWLEYYGRYAGSALYPVFRYVNLKLRARNDKYWVNQRPGLKSRDQKPRLKGHQRSGLGKGERLRE